MDNKILKQRIRGIQDDMRRLSNDMFALETSNYKDYPENFLELSLDTAVRAEKIACKLRHLIGDYGIVKRESLMKRVAESQGIEVKREGEIFMITIPRYTAMLFRNSYNTNKSRSTHGILELFNRFSFCSMASSRET